MIEASGAPIVERYAFDVGTTVRPFKDRRSQRRIGVSGVVSREDNWGTSGEEGKTSEAKFCRVESIDQEGIQYRIQAIYPGESGYFMVYSSDGRRMLHLIEPREKLVQTSFLTP